MEEYIYKDYILKIEVLSAWEWGAKCEELNYSDVDNISTIRQNFKTFVDEKVNRDKRNEELKGARLVKIEFGLVADLPIDIQFNTPYYILFTFWKGASQFTEYYPVGSKKELCVFQSDLGKILKSKESVSDKTDRFTFIDDTWYELFDLEGENK